MIETDGMPKLGGDNCTILPDGSAFATLDLPLPKDHWIYKRDADGFVAVEPIVGVMGRYVTSFIVSTNDGMVEDSNIRQPDARKIIRKAAMNAIRAATNSGSIESFDPDAMVRNFELELLGRDPELLSRAYAIDETEG